MERFRGRTRRWPGFTAGVGLAVVLSSAASCLLPEARLREGEETRELTPAGAGGAGGATSSVGGTSSEHLIEGQRLAAKGKREAVVRARVSVAEAEHTAALLDFGTIAPVDLGLTAQHGLQPSGELGADTGAAWRTGGWVAVGVGGSALLFSGIAGLIAYGQLDDFDCSADPCRSSSSDDVDTYNPCAPFRRSVTSREGSSPRRGSGCCSSTASPTRPSRWG